jgi:hypothetical protein
MILKITRLIANSKSKVALPLAGERSDIADAGITVFGERDRP